MLTPVFSNVFSRPKVGYPAVRHAATLPEESLFQPVTPPQADSVHFSAKNEVKKIKPKKGSKEVPKGTTGRKPSEKTKGQTARDVSKDAARHPGGASGFVKGTY
jgi:hypothetical protein